MKLSKTNKILLLLSILALAILMACSTMNVFSASAGTFDAFSFNSLDTQSYVIFDKANRKITVAKNYKISSLYLYGSFDGTSVSIEDANDVSTCFSISDSSKGTVDTSGVSFSASCALTITKDSKTANYRIKVVDKLVVLKSNAFNVENYAEADTYNGSISLANAITYAHSNSTGLYGYVYSNNEGENESKTISITNDNFVFDDTKVVLTKNSSNFGLEILDSSLNEVVSDVKVYDPDDASTQIATYKLTVINDTNAPEYVSNYSDYKETFESKLESNLKTTSGTYVQLGSGKTITIPSMKDFVADNVSPYDKLNYQVYYKNQNTTDFVAYPTSFSSTSTLKLEVKNPGTYYFYVLFEDVKGNVMEIDEDTNKIKGTSISVDDITFSFTIYENYPVTVSASEATLSNGFVDSKYTVGTSVFTTEGCTPNYTLLYSTTQDGVFSELSSDDAKEVSFSTSDLSFTPNKTGYYKIECVGTSTSTGVESNTASIVVYVGDEVSAVKVPSAFATWVKGHVLAVVFLGIGVLCLIGIIVLLFIKPKDELEIETVKPKKASKKN